jgi:hypothetical protein
MFLGYFLCKAFVMVLAIFGLASDEEIEYTECLSIDWRVLFKEG